MQGAWVPSLVRDKIPHDGTKNKKWWNYFLPLGWEDPLEKGMTTHSKILA